ncbi:MAG: type I-U CRISPR-associated protein Cas7 [Planctomycetes bacterium]|nr:type I-U CRISPR-associated protein Cas7 [Planctomycetota bacterium]
MSETISKYDSWLVGDDGPAALVIREYLMPVEGHDGVVFPPTFAAGDGFKGGYNIDRFSDEKDGKNVCLIDSVGSQANRIEPIFAEPKYAKLIPQIVIKAGEKEVNLLEAGHRAGDAIVRCSELQEELNQAFEEVLKGNAEPLAKIAPTSLVFGAWDSRDTQAKVPRLVSSVIRAFDVLELTRSAQYIPAVDYVAEGLLDDPKDKTVHDVYAQRGFIHVPATGSPGGVIATGGIRRDATLSLAALQQLKVDNDADRTLALRRYILGLALVAFTAKTPCYLRQGCNLVLDPDKPREFVEVYRDGRRVPASITHDDALAYAIAAADAFGVGESRTVEFDKNKAKEDVAKEKTKK